MKKIINCKICFQDKDTNIILEHINPTGDISEHQMCKACYSDYKDKTKCPFCNLKLKVSFEDSGMDELDYAMYLEFLKFGNSDENIYNEIYYILRNIDNEVNHTIRDE
jgi:hypothetical protein